MSALRDSVGGLALMYGEDVDPVELVDRLFLGTVASCTCLTKTPEVSAHDRGCRFRLLMEAAWVIQRFMVAEVSS